MLFVVCFAWLRVVRCLLFVVCWLSCVACWFVFAVWCVWFGMSRLSFVG